ncbi:MAG: hypothetical protein RI958_2981 [Actinomycetota bacterium]
MTITGSTGTGSTSTGSTSTAEVLPCRSTLAPLRNGRRDPTTRLAAGEFWRATLTPDGPGTVWLDWRDGTLRVRTWGPGGDWLRAAVPAITGALDRPVQFTHAHPAVLRAQRNHPTTRIGASRTLYHDLLPTVLAQRITALEAFRQWERLCTESGEPAPGQIEGLRLPPTPERLGNTPSWSLHHLGIERRRADALTEVARHAHHLWNWSQRPSSEAATKLAGLRGIGEWTIGVVLATALGEPDAIAVGDFHLKNMVAWALADRPRGSDDEMVQLLEPYRGQRGRVVRLLQLDGHRAPAFGPRQRILPMHRW